MRFIDANVFIYAVLRPKKNLPEHVLAMKRAANAIFLRVNDGEPVLTTTVHLSEVANVLEDAAGLPFATDFLAALFTKPGISVLEVTPDTYRESIHLAKKTGISVNDALAVVVMEMQGISEIYTFDRHFQRTGVTVVRE